MIAQVNDEAGIVSDDCKNEQLKGGSAAQSDHCKNKRLRCGFECDECDGGFTICARNCRQPLT